VDNLVNFGYGTVVTAPSVGNGQVMTVSAMPLPTPPFDFVVWPPESHPLTGNAEVLRCTARTGVNCTVTRKTQGSLERSIGAGDQVMAAVTKGLLEQLDKASTTGALVNLGSTAGPINLDLSQKAKLYKVTITAPATALNIVNAPEGSTELGVLFKVGTAGATLAVAGVEWIGEEPAFSSTLNAENFIALMVVNDAGTTKVYALG
jgi:hypothetical protein